MQIEYIYKLVFSYDQIRELKQKGEEIKTQQFDQMSATIIGYDAEIQRIRFEVDTYDNHGVTDFTQDG